MSKGDDADGLLFALVHGTGAVVIGALLMPSAAAMAQLPPAPTEPSSAPPGPRAYVPERLIELGTIVEGETTDVVWRIENHGDSDLVITKTAASCGCTVIALSEEDSTIPPGEHLDLTARFDSRGRRGNQTKEVYVHSNDPSEPKLTLKFHTHVQPLYNVNPAGLVNLRMVRRGDPILRTVDIEPAQGRRRVSLLGIEAKDDSPVLLTHESVNLGDGRTGIRIRLAIAQDVPLGRLRSSATVKFAVDGVEREHTLSIRGDIVGDLTYRPVVLDVTRIPSLPGKRLAPVVLESTDRTPFEVVSVSAGPLFDVEVKAGKGARAKTMCSVYLTVRKDAPAGPFGETLVIQTDSLDQPIITLPVFGIVAPAVEVEPPMILLRADGSKVGTQRRVKVRAASTSTTLVPSRIECDIPGVSAKIDDGASARYRHMFYMEVTLTGKLSAGQHEGTLTIATEAPGIGDLRIPVVVSVPNG